MFITPDMSRKENKQNYGSHAFLLFPWSIGVNVGNDKMEFLLAQTFRMIRKSEKLKYNN